MRESATERKLRQEIRKIGGTSLKQDSESGIPDRLVLLPGGRAIFVELKAEHGRASARQAYQIARLQALGFEAYVLRQDTPTAVEDFVASIMKAR